MGCFLPPSLQGGRSRRCRGPRAGSPRQVFKRLGALTSPFPSCLGILLPLASGTCSPAAPLSPLAPPSPSPSTVCLSALYSGRPRSLCCSPSCFPSTPLGAPPAHPEPEVSPVLLDLTAEPESEVRCPRDPAQPAPPHIGQGLCSGGGVPDMGGPDLSASSSDRRNLKVTNQIRARGIIAPLLWRPRETQPLSARLCESLCFSWKHGYDILVPALGRGGVCATWADAVGLSIPFRPLSRELPSGGKNTGLTGGHPWPRGLNTPWCTPPPPRPQHHWPGYKSCASSAPLTPPWSTLPSGP